MIIEIEIKGEWKGREKHSFDEVLFHRFHKRFIHLIFFKR